MLETLDYLTHFFTNLWPIIVIIATICGILSILLTFYFRPRGEIDCIISDEINLVNEISSRFSELEIIYKKVPSADQLFYVRGHIINVGNIDIDESMIYDPIRLTTVHSDYQIVEVLVNTTDSNFSIIAIGANIKFSLMKVNEHCSFEALLKSQSPAKRQNILKLAGRIKNTKLSTRRYHSPAFRFEKLWHWLAAFALSILLISILITSPYYLIREQYDTFTLVDKKFNQLIYLIDMDEQHVRINPIAVWGGPPDGPRNEIIAKSQILENERFRFIPDRNRFSWLPYPLVALSSLFVLITIFCGIWTSLRYRRISAVLE